MHTVQYVVADVGGEFNESNEYYEGILSGVIPEQSWSDWWVVGGRWDGYLHEELNLKRHLMETGAPGAPTLAATTQTLSLIEHACDTVKTIGLITREERDALVSVLKHRQSTIADRLSAAQHQFPSISDWGMNP